MKPQGDLQWTPLRVVISAIRTKEVVAGEGLAPVVHAGVAWHILRRGTRSRIHPFLVYFYLVPGRTLEFQNITQRSRIPDSETTYRSQTNEGKSMLRLNAKQYGRVNSWHTHIEQQEDTSERNADTLTSPQWGIADAATGVAAGVAIAAVVALAGGHSDQSTTIVAAE